MMTDPDHIAVRIVVHGRVQGVWYRGWAIDQARARGLAGWIRNRRTGTVEALLIGPAAAVNEMIEACRSGPVAARVKQIEEHPAGDVTGAAVAGFDQRPTL